jgi:hypothetical protein
MTTNESTRPDTAHLAAAREAARLEHSRLGKLLGGAVCLLALVAGVAAGLVLRAASAEVAMLAPRRATVASFSLAEKDHLRRQHTRFTLLSAEQQEHLRSFDAELASADDAEALRGTLRRYNDWLRTISPAERGELLKLATQPARRVQRVEELSPLSHPDTLAVEQWLKACAKARAPKNVGNFRDDQLLSWGQWLLFQPFGGREASRPAVKLPFGAPRPLDEAEFAKLSGELSALRRSELEREKGLNEKRRLVSSWWQRRRTPSETRFGPATADELVRFYTEDLSDEARSTLMALPREQRNGEMREELRKFNNELDRFLNQELSKEERQRLLALPLEQRNRELREAYHKFNSELDHFLNEELSKEARQRLLALPLEQRNRELREEYRKAKAAEGLKGPPRPGDGT